MVIDNNKNICELLDYLASLFTSSKYMFEVSTSKIHIATIELKFEELKNDNKFVKVICIININDNIYSTDDKISAQQLISCIEDSLLKGTSPNNTASFENCINGIITNSISKVFYSKYVPLTALFKNATYAIYDNENPLVAVSTIDNSELRYGIELIWKIGQNCLPPSFLLDSDFFTLNNKFKIGTLHSEIHDKILELRNFIVYSYSPLYPEYLFKLNMAQEQIVAINLDTNQEILDILKDCCKNPQNAILKLTNYKRQQKNINLADLID